MPRALARHERIIADAAAARDGAVLKQKGEGDSTFAVFARVSDATAAALACQRALQCEDWPNGITLYAGGTDLVAYCAQRSPHRVGRVHRSGSDLVLDAWPSVGIGRPTTSHEGRC